MPPEITANMVKNEIPGSLLKNFDHPDRVIFLSIGIHRYVKSYRDNQTNVQDAL